MENGKTVTRDIADVLVYNLLQDMGTHVRKVSDEVEVVNGVMTLVCYREVLLDVSPKIYSTLEGILISNWFQVTEVKPIKSGIPQGMGPKMGSFFTSVVAVQLTVHLYGISLPDGQL